MNTLYNSQQDASSLHCAILHVCVGSGWQTQNKAQVNFTTPGIKEYSRVVFVFEQK